MTDVEKGEKEYGERPSIIVRAKGQGERKQKKEERKDVETLRDANLAFFILFWLQ